MPFFSVTLALAPMGIVIFKICVHFKRVLLENQKCNYIIFLLYIAILREKSLAIYFEDSQFRRNRTFNIILSNIYVDKRSRIR